MGRFLSPDPYVQLPEFSQNFNRYSYCLNNPLKYNDPDGEWIHLLIGAIVGGVINTIAHRDQIDNFWDGLAAFGIGAGGGLLTAATGGAVLGAFGTTAAVSAGAGGFLGGSLSAGVGYLYGTAFMSLGNNAYFGDPMPTGKQFFTGLGLSMITAGVLQGSNALANGRSFWKGVLDEVPQRIEAPLLPTPKAEINSNALKAEMEPMPIATERLPQSQTFNRIASGDGRTQWVNAEAAKGGYGSMMEAGEAARYAKYWESYAPKQISPGTTRMDWLRVSGRTGRMESSRVIYDNYGRQLYRVDFSNHMRPLNHSVPHLHQYQYGPMSSFGKESVFNFFGK